MGWEAGGSLNGPSLFVGVTEVPWGRPCLHPTLHSDAAGPFRTVTVLVTAEINRALTSCLLSAPRLLASDEETAVES